MTFDLGDMTLTLIFRSPETLSESDLLQSPFVRRRLSSVVNHLHYRLPLSNQQAQGYDIGPVACWDEGLPNLFK